MMSELLIEKEQIQIKLSAESASVHEYLARAQLAVKELATEYGFKLQYVEMPNRVINTTMGDINHV